MTGKRVEIHVNDKRPHVFIGHTTGEGGAVRRSGLPVRMPVGSPSDDPLTRLHRAVSSLPPSSKPGREDEAAGLARRFWASVDRRGSDECWPWLAEKTNGGYGRFRANGPRVGAHRYVWTMTNGPIPDGLWVLHRCDNRPCVNPSHLFLGTSDDNIADRGRKDRSAKGVTNGIAKLTPEQVAVIRAASSRRGDRAALARRYGVSVSTLRDIRAGLTWRAK